MVWQSVQPGTKTVTFTDHVSISICSNMYIYILYVRHVLGLFCQATGVELRFPISTIQFVSIPRNDAALQAAGDKLSKARRPSGESRKSSAQDVQVGSS